MTVHNVTFQRNREATVQYRAQCVCGWIGWSTNLEQLQAQAATHDFEWQEIKQEAKQNETTDDKPK